MGGRDVAGPALCCLALALDVGRGQVFVGLDFDDPVSAVGLDDEEVRVVFPTTGGPEKGQLAGVESDPAGDLDGVIRVLATSRSGLESNHSMV